MQKTTGEQGFESHFGTCPECHEYDGWLNAGSSHRFYCKEHRTSWLVGSNLFSDWRSETEEEQRHKWNELGMDNFQNVEPFYPPQPEAHGREAGTIANCAINHVEAPHWSPKGSIAELERVAAVLSAEVDSLLAIHRIAANKHRLEGEWPMAGLSESRFLGLIGGLTASASVIQTAVRRVRVNGFLQDERAYDEP